MNTKVQAVMVNCAVWIKEDQEPIRISACLDEHIEGIGEESGDTYYIDYTEINLDTDMFYELVKMDITKYTGGV